jgi:hypothetical protein
VHPIEPFARQAFAAGWASTGGPLTGRVHAACTVAVQLAVEHADDPRILEATLDLGKLEGHWATVYDRRDRLIRQYTDTVNDAWRTLIRPRLFRDGLHHLRAELGLTEAQRDQTQIKAAALAAAAAMLHALPETPGWAVLRQSIRDALAAGQAEGIVSAVAIAANGAGKDGLDWDTSFQRAYQQLERLDTLWSQAGTWQQRLLDRATTDLARVLAQLAEDDASYEEMLDGASRTLDAARSGFVAFIVDWLMTTAVGAGMLALYQRQGVTVIDWITAGDGNVCASCQDNEDNGPYTPDAFPACPDHPRCRCTPSADLDLTGYSGWFT